jgi:hypothetical protein
MKLLPFIACTIISLNSYSQNFRKDTRPDSVKEDYMDNYQASQISKVDLLSALDNLGVRVFNCQLLPRFIKTYKLTVDLDEFVNGKIISTKDISPDEKNLYFFWDQDKQYADYINKIKLITRDADSVSVLTIDIMGNTTGGIRLKKHLGRKHQFYLWRRFSITNWTLNTKVPMLVYSSSWYDKRFDIERSCGAVDLSKDKAATKELIDNSPHYFLISYRISE